MRLAWVSVISSIITSSCKTLPENRPVVTFDPYVCMERTVTFSMDVSSRKPPGGPFASTISIPDLLLSTHYASDHHQPHSLFHWKRFEESMASQGGVDYDEFCAMEERMARILYSYTEDRIHPWCIIVPPEFLFSDSLRSYGTLEEIGRIVWVTPSKDVGVPDFIRVSEGVFEGEACL